ncbi:hypothetical protein DSBG_3052 [Desulfosporosinus sp. BG]|nr:hypothetical protein DSBG_3052 [Desulfosporosinus sp. BG]
MWVRSGFRTAWVEQMCELPVHMRSVAVYLTAKQAAKPLGFLHVNPWLAYRFAV